MKGIILFTEDYRQASTSSNRLRKALVSLFDSTITYALSRAIHLYNPKRVVTSRYLKGKNPNSLRENIIDYMAVTTKGLTPGKAEEVLRFSNALIALAEKSSPKNTTSHGISIPKTLELRVILADILELLIKPAEGISRTIDESGCTSVGTLTRQSLPERYARSIAENKKLPVVSLDPVISLTLAALTLARTRRDFWTRRITPTEQRAAYYRLEGETQKDGDLPHAEILCFAAEERRVRRAGTIAEELKKAGVTTVIGSTSEKKETLLAIGELSQCGYRTSFINHHFDATEATQLVPIAKKAAQKAWGTIAAHHKTHLSHRYLGIPIFEALSPLFKQTWVSAWVESALFIESCSHYLETAKPRLVVLFDSGLHSSVLLQLCRSMGIRTVFYINNPFLFTPSHTIPILDQAFKADYVLTTTPFMRDRYLALAPHPPEKIFVVGDVFARSTAPLDRDSIRKTLLGQLGVGPDTKVVVILSAYLQSDTTLDKKKHFFDMIFLACAGLVNTQIIVKAHPNETISSLKGQMSQWGHQAPILHDCSLFDLFAASDLACMTFSQAGIEAIMSGIPLVIVQGQDTMPGYDEWLPLVKEGAARHVPEDGDATGIIQQILFDEEFRAAQIAAGYRFAEKYVSALDGRSGARVAQVLKGILENP